MQGKKCALTLCGIHAIVGVTARFSAGLRGLFQQSEGPLLLYLLIVCLSEGGHAAATQRHTQCYCQIFEKSAPARIIAVGFALLIFAGRGAADAAVCRTPRRTRRPAGRAVYRNERRLCDRAGRGGHRRHVQPVRAGCHCDFDTDRRSGRRVHRHGAGVGCRAAHQLKGPLPRAGGTERREPGRAWLRLVRAILLVTLICEVAGAVLSFPSFARDHMPLQAVWLSIFHSIAAFNNAGFDALGGGQSLIPYQNDLLLNLVTDALVIVGGIGFMVILDVGAAAGSSAE